MSDVLYRGFGVGQKWSIADLRRLKNTPHLYEIKFPRCRNYKE